MLSDSVVDFVTHRMSLRVIFQFKTPQAAKIPGGLFTKHSEGALFLIVDLSNPLVITHVTFESRETMEGVCTESS